MKKHCAICTKELLVVLEPYDPECCDECFFNLIKQDLVKNKDK